MQAPSRPPGKSGHAPLAEPGDGVRGAHLQPPDDREALRRERDFSDALLEATGALIAVIDREGRVLRFNRMSQEISGYRLDDFQSRPFWEIMVPPDEVESAKAVVRDLIVNKRPNQWEGYLVTKTGERRLIRWSSTVLLDDAGELLAILGTGIDITLQRRAEEEAARLLLLERRARADAEWAERRASFLEKAVAALNTSFEDYPSTPRRIARLAVPHLAEWCLVSTRPHDGIIATTVFAHADPEIEGRVSPLCAPDFPAGAAPWIARGGSPIVVDADPARPGAARDSYLAAYQGEQREVVARALRELKIEAYMVVPLRARDHVIGVMVFGSGRVGHRFDPEALILAEALAARAALALDNARLYHEARTATQVRDEFLVAASHELRTPCTSMLLGIQRLIRRAEAGTFDALPIDARLRELKRCEQQAQRLVSLVDRLLDATRVAASPLPLVREEVDLVALVSEVVGQRNEAAAAAGSPIHTHAGAPIVGRWDRARIAQVLTGVLENALKYGAAHPVEVRVEADAREARVSVEDQGIGIDWRRRERLFQRFGRAAPIERYGGLGLDLYLARVIVEAHGGTLQVHSRAGRGSTFVIALPRDEGATTEA
jgi:PAS domain S-box-containing protein